MPTVYRSQLSTLWVTLQSNETLGILDSDYLEDYYGSDGQVTLHHIDSGIDYPVLMLHAPEETPNIPFDVFRGQSSLATLPDGNYEIRGRCRDLAGNYTILSAFQSPIGSEQTLSLGFQIIQGSVYRCSIGVLIRMAITASTLRPQSIEASTLSFCACTG